MDMCCCAWCPQRSGEGIGSFRTKVMDGAGNQTLVLCKNKCSPHNEYLSNPTKNASEKGE